MLPPSCSYQDGTKPPERLSEYASKKQLRQLPSLLEYFSYLFAAGNLLAGPFFEAHDYFDYVDRKASEGKSAGGRHNMPVGALGCCDLMVAWSRDF